MMAASIKTTLELWALSLREIKGRMRLLFTQARVARSAGLFQDGLLGAERRKTGWMRAEAAGDRGLALASYFGSRPMGWRCVARYCARLCRQKSRRRQRGSGH